MTLTIAILLLIGLNGIFVAAEFALIGTARALVERRSEEGDRRASRALVLLRDPHRQDRYLAATQLGINLASLALGMVGEQKLAILLSGPLAALGLGGAVTTHALALTLSVGLLTVFHIVLGEIVPKTLALAHSERVLLALITPIRAFMSATWPLIAVLNASGHAVLRLMGIRRDTSVRVPSAEVLRHAVEESVSRGELELEAGEVLDELFDFGDLSADQVMTPRVRIVGLPRGASPDQVRKALARGRHARYPVYEETLDRIVGIVLIRDLLGVLLNDEPLPDRLIRHVPFMPETSKLETLLKRMRTVKTQFVVVMDEHGGTAGIVTVEDVFEEIVGEFSDSPAAPLPVYRAQGELRALGEARLDRVGDELDIELDHPDVDSVSGLVLTLLERPARVGDTVSFGGLEFRVRSLQGRGVGECAVRRLPDENVTPDAEP